MLPISKRIAKDAFILSQKNQTMGKTKKTTIRVLIDLPISTAKNLRTISNNKGFANRKKFIEYICIREEKIFLNKQSKLEL